MEIDNTMENILPTLTSETLTYATQLDGDTEEEIRRLNEMQDFDDDMQSQIDEKKMVKATKNDVIGEQNRHTNNSWMRQYELRKLLRDMNNDGVNQIEHDIKDQQDFSYTKGDHDWKHNNEQYVKNELNFRQRMYKMENDNLKHHFQEYLFLRV
eukprot:6490294-Amphidinium_carterae.4